MVEIVPSNAVVRIVLRDQVTFDDAAVLASAAAHAATRDLELEAGDAGYIHTAAVQMLVAFHRDASAHDHKFQIVSLSESARQVLSVAGLGSWLKEVS